MCLLRLALSAGALADWQRTPTAAGRPHAGTTGNIRRWQPPISDNDDVDDDEMTSPGGRCALITWPSSATASITWRTDSAVLLVDVGGRSADGNRSDRSSWKHLLLLAFAWRGWRVSVAPSLWLFIRSSDFNSTAPSVCVPAGSAVLGPCAGDGPPAGDDWTARQQRASDNICTDRFTSSEHRLSFLSTSTHTSTLHTHTHTHTASDWVG